MTKTRTVPVARDIAIGVELLILGAAVLSLLWAVRIMLFDLWLGPKYRPMVTIALTIVGGVLMVFLVAHLISFYPP